MPVQNLKPIPLCKKFFLRHDKRLFGFTAEGISEIKIKTVKDEEIKIMDFFRIKDVLYIDRDVEENSGTEIEPIIEAKKHFYKQDKGSMQEIGSFPAKPQKNYGLYQSKQWLLEKVPYKSGFVSKLTNLFFKGQVTFRMIEDCYETENGIFFNVKQSEMRGKKEALYYFPLNRTSCSRVQEAGEIW